MRTDDPSPNASPTARLHARVDGARRWLAARGPGARWALALAALAALVAAGYFAGTTGEPDPMTWLLNGRRFSAEDGARVVGLLAAGGIDAAPDGSGRIGIRADQARKALALLAKQKAAPSLREIQDESARSSWLESPADLERRERRERERALESKIERCPGVDTAYVTIRPLKARSRPYSSRRVAASVLLIASEGRPISRDTLMSIPELLRSEEPELADEDVRVFDGEGRPLLVGGNPDMGARTLAHARGEELQDQIYERLSLIEGVRVFVTLRPAPTAGALPPLPGEAVAVNQPAEADDATAAAPPRAGDRADVLIEVPTSYYLDSFRGLHPGREPSKEDLQPFVKKAAESIRHAVASVLPEGDLGELTIEPFYAPAPRRPAAPADSPPRGRPWWLAAAGAGGVLAVAMAAAGGRWLATRRGSRRVARPFRRPHYDVAAGTGPSERVRELVRRDPEAATGVLNRWIGGGGSEA